MTDDPIAEIRALRERLAALEKLATAAPAGDAMLTRETLKKMTPDAINADWAEVSAFLAAGPTPPAPAAAAEGDPAKPPDRAADLRREKYGAPPAPAAPVALTGPPALTTDEIRKMTPDAINADWDRVSEALKGNAK